VIIQIGGGSAFSQSNAIETLITKETVTKLHQAMALAGQAAASDVRCVPRGGDAGHRHAAAGRQACALLPAPPSVSSFPCSRRCSACSSANSQRGRLQAVQTNGAAAVDLASRPRPEYVPGRIDDPDYVRIFDTTLRDGEQSPGATLTEKEKLDIARMLHKLGVDIIEAGFPVASPGDFAAVRQIAEEVGNNVDGDGYVPVICGLSRTKLKDLEARPELSSGLRSPLNAPVFMPRAWCCVMRHMCSLRPALVLVLRTTGVWSAAACQQVSSVALRMRAGSMERGAGGKAATGTHVPGDLAHPHEVQAAHVGGRGAAVSSRSGLASQGTGMRGH